jgi:methylated-DNA-[protein]-cysteine S-methyltransferase
MVTFMIDIPCAWRQSTQPKQSFELWQSPAIGEPAMPHLAFATPLGDLTLFEEDEALVAIDWGHAAGGRATPLLREAQRQIEAYFDGDLRDFDLPLAPAGTPFQRRLWAELQRIPYGRTASYGDIAHRLDSGPRAVGGACGRNPLPIVVPCHRVLAAGKKIGGYSGLDGLDTKRFLLRLEGVL